jgi:hypothetical protein
MTIRRGGYMRGRGRIHVLKFRADSDLNATIRKMAEHKQVAIASVVRELVQCGLSEKFKHSVACSASGE